MSEQVKKLLDDLALAAQQGGMGSYDGGNYEVSAFEAYLSSQGYGAADAAAMARKAVQVPAIGNKIREAMGSQGAGRMTDAGYKTPISAATFQISVTRNTAAIAADLPFAIFGSQDVNVGYRNILAPLIPAGVTLTSVVAGELGGGGAAGAQRVRFTWTDGVGVDTVDVTSSTYPYPALLSSTADNLLKMSKIRMKISNTAVTRQFDIDLVAMVSSPFGKSEQNRTTPSQFIAPDQFQAGVTDIDQIYRVDKETSLVSLIANTTALSINYSMFVEKYFRQITKGGF